MTRILITGMSGAGKTTLLEELNRRGHFTVDTDYEGWTMANGLWDDRRMAQLLADRDDVIVSGTVENQADFYHYFSHIVLLSAPLDVLLERVRTRTNSPYGKTAEQRTEIRRYFDSVEPLLRRGATSELDGTQPPAFLADAIEFLLRGESHVS